MSQTKSDLAKAIQTIVDAATTEDTYLNRTRNERLASSLESRIVKSGTGLEVEHGVVYHHGNPTNSRTTDVRILASLFDDKKWRESHSAIVRLNFLIHGVDALEIFLKDTTAKALAVAILDVTDDPYDSMKRYRPKK